MQLYRSIELKTATSTEDVVQDQLTRLGITRAVAPKVGAVFSYVVVTHLIGSKSPKNVVSYNNLTAALVDYKERFDKLNASGDMVTLQVLTTLGTIVLDMYVNTEFR